MIVAIVEVFLSHHIKNSFSYVYRNMYIASPLERKEYFMIDSLGMFGINLFLCKRLN